LVYPAFLDSALLDEMMISYPDSSKERKAHGRNIPASLCRRFKNGIRWSQLV
jgi:hypothetical protein